MKIPLLCTSSALKAARLGLAFAGLTAMSAPALLAAPGFQSLPGHIPALVASARPVAAVDATQPISLALALPLRNQAELQDLLHGLSDPSDPRFGQFLTPEQFAARYSPTPEEYSRVIAYAQAMGLTVTATHPNRTLLDVAAPAGQVEKAFGLHLRVYQTRADGRYFFAPDAEPQVPSALASLVTGVVGLSSASRWEPHLHLHPAPTLEISAVLDPLSIDPAVAPQAGTGVSGGLSPSDIKTAYNLSSVSQNGSGQILGLFELDGYTASDITSYEAYYGLPNVPLQNVLVDSVTGVPSNTSGAAEVTLDIELQAALAPNASKILVYEGPNSDAGVVDTYSRIASDNIAKEISTSWGEAENSAPASVRSSENTAFQQMAAQGQSIYAASGDSGANDNGSSLSVDDPASQPYMVGVGGTSLTTTSPGGAYQSETTWNNNIGAGGGGISTVWTIPSYQTSLAGSAASKGSTSYRNVPDVSLDADPYTGYSVYYKGGWTVYGGTSCAAPLWAAFTALVNQKRMAAGVNLLGFANPPIYALAASVAYANDFHDVAGGSTNGYYPAVAGYDDATGLGTFNGANLLADLSGIQTTPVAPTALTATAGNAQIALSWTASTGAAGYNLYRSTSTGTETLYKSGLTATSYTDTGLTNGTAYFYQVAAVNSAGTSGKSGEASATPHAVAATQINAGGGASGTFAADADFSGGSTYATGAAIDTSGVTSPAAQAVYQTERYGSFTYTLPNLTPGASYTLRLHFAEIYWNSAGQRLFNVSVNGAAALTNFDIFAAAGGQNKAVVESFPVTADANGKVAVVFTTVKDNAKLSGLELAAAPARTGTAQINAGGGASGTFSADTDASGGSTYATGATIDTSGVTSPAPQSVYQTERYGSFTYTLPGLTPGASYTLRLHFAEIYWNSAGQRLFNVSVNGAAALTNFDIFAAAGGQNKAVVETVPVTADANGKVAVVFTTVKDNAKLSGLELQ